MANYKTITLTGAEAEVKIDDKHCDIRNDGTDVVYASCRAGVVPGADGVVSVPPGQAAKMLDVCICGKVYLFGTGTVQLCGNDYGYPVFKSAASSTGGGGTEDTVARNAINAHAANGEIHITAEKAIEAAATTISNPNLLINSDLAVNQRGVSSVEVTDEEYTRICDMWRAKAASGTGAVTVGDGVVILGAGCAMVQRLEKAAELDGLQLSYSVCVEGEVVSGTFVWDSVKNYATVASGVVQLAYSGSERYVQIYNSSAADVSVEWVKLEQGSHATLFALPDPATELVKCQRYLVSYKETNGYITNSTHVATGFAISETAARFELTLPQPMRTKPTLISDNMKLMTTDTFTCYDITELIPVWSISQNKLTIQATLNDAVMTKGDVVMLCHYGVSSLLVSAEL